MSELAAFDVVDLIRQKRDGGVLSDAEISWLIRSYVASDIADEQVAALLMAIVWRGLDSRELSAWTAAMVASGERLDLSDSGRPTVGKHSTGGVGDKVSLVLAPVLAACGAAVPKLSGRGLGHTGGTLDKLESIPGWRATLSIEEVLAQLASVGAVICAPGPGLAPADRKLYALRDVTGTVESIPLIASSIMSKKIAEGTDALVLDVKCGGGAFMKTRGDAVALARTMVQLGRDAGLSVAALVTGMDVPLGRAVGNALEVTEAVETLSGRGPDDLVEVVLALAREMCRVTGLDEDPARVLSDGSALRVWRSMIAAQGGDPDATLARAPHVGVVRAERSGVLTRLEARAVGVAAWRLGAGRSRKEDAISPAAGVVCLRKPGESVAAGDVVLELHCEDAARLPRALAALEGHIAVDDEAFERAPLVLERVE